MKVFWWQCGIHIEAETPEESKAMVLLYNAARRTDLFNEGPRQEGPKQPKPPVVLDEPESTGEKFVTKLPDSDCGPSRRGAGDAPALLGRAKKITNTAEQLVQLLLANMDDQSDILAALASATGIVSTFPESPQKGLTQRL